VSLSFSNSTPEPIWLVYAHNDSGCASDGDPWMKEGWWEIQPGGSVTVRGGPVNGAKYFFYTEGGAVRIWAGEFGTSVPLDSLFAVRFLSQCWERRQHRQPAGVHAQDRDPRQFVQPHHQSHVTATVSTRPRGLSAITLAPRQYSTPPSLEISETFDGW